MNPDELAFAIGNAIGEAAARLCDLACLLAPFAVAGYFVVRWLKRRKAKAPGE